mmetsp:Transcript_23831/g.67384  ORF Transcript_23831/g.67384 Transcript_23831/m.67384 type:complete len:244 (+) Transcript_23831:214-945(+)
MTDIEKQQTNEGMLEVTIASNSAGSNPVPVVMDVVPVVPDKYGAPETGISHAGLPMHQQEKLGRKCCFCCCDYRRAVVIMGIVSIVFSTISVIANLAGSERGSDGEAQIGSDLNSEEVEFIVDEMRTAQIVTDIFSIIFSLCAIYGAKSYNKHLVMANAVYILAAYIALTIKTAQVYDDLEDETGESVDQPIGSYISGVIFAGLWAHPSIGFVYEVRKGIMSEETYPREEFSCCCVNKGEVNE